MAKSEGTNLNVNDAKGKLHEIGVLYCLSGNVWSNTVHYRSHGYGPEDVYRICTETVGDDISKTIMDDSYITSLEIRSKLVDDGIMANIDSYWNAAWTSREDFPETPGDHEKYTGVKDLNSEADLMITVEDGPIGLSLKYGESLHFTLKNPGKETLEEILGLENLDKHRENHVIFLKELGYSSTCAENHSTYKEERNSIRAKRAEESGRKYRRAIASDIRNSMMRMSSDEIKEFVLRLCANPTVFTHYRSLTRSTSSGVERHIADIKKHSRKMSDRYDIWSIRDDSTTCVTVVARNISTNIVEPVAKLSVKARSGPMNGWNGNFTAPMLIERNEKIKAKKLFAFDMDETLFHYDHEEAPKIRVISEDGKHLLTLSSHEYPSYVRNPGEKYCYRQFEDASNFELVASPIERMLKVLRNKVDNGDHVAIVTARRQFDDNELFLSTLRKFGIDTDKVEVYLSGIIPAGSTSEAKKIQFRMILEKEDYTSVKFWDDNAKNLLGFLELRDEFPNVKFEAVQVYYNAKKSTLRTKRFS